MATSKQQGILSGRDWSRSALVRAVLFVIASTIALTASFLGVVGLLTGEVTGLNSRLPLYVLVMALAFVTAILIQRENPVLSAKDECSDRLSEPRTEQGGILSLN
ncbi:hypothetical protein ACFQJ7_06760 [Halovenus rubra]|uniref:Uncharacterized protein n=2 Tax=Halovenus rubra TaxID=869890 RepID=A0ABD5X5D4_9EURY|nr:hypothetical protein [Halovenus rubra]